MTANVPTYSHPTPDVAWLDRYHEEILEPALPIVDAHHHLWDRSGDPYLLNDLLQDTGSGHNVVATVFTQCGWAYRTGGAEELRPVGETESAVSAACEAEKRREGTRVCAAIVGTTDFRLAEKVDTVLEAHISAGAGRFRGIRQVTARHAAFLATILTPPPFGLMSDKLFRIGVSRLQQFGLSLDAWLYHTQIEELRDLARAFPAVPMILNHFGGPLGIGPYENNREQVFGEWSSRIRDLATCPNVLVKLGGLGMIVHGFDFRTRTSPPSSLELSKAWRPYFETCIESFGADRCMFESNFPVDKAQCSYAVLWNAFKRIASGASAGEKAALFHGTAERIYDLH
jgi:predicted TIM-barrel fold metal-dependent hydrolase